MTAETNHNIGDEVRFITLNGRATMAKIIGIKIIRSKNTLIEYLFLDCDLTIRIFKFPTKEELLKNL